MKIISKKIAKLVFWVLIAVTLLGGCVPTSYSERQEDALVQACLPAINEFLAEHCGEEAQAKLDETCAIAKPSRLPEWLLLLLGFGACVAIFVLWERAKEWITWPELPQSAAWVFEALLWGFLILTLFPDEHWSRLRQLWHDRADNENGLAAVLAEMHRVTQMTRWQVLDKGNLWLRIILYGAFIIVRVCSWIAFSS